MAATTAQVRRYTVADLEQFPDDGVKRELVDGQIVEWGMPNWRHGFFLAALSRLLGQHALEHRLGAVVGGDPYVRVQGSEHDVRGPDVAFYARGRIPSDMAEASTAMAPDFVVELLSPSDRAAAVDRKVDDWLRAGVRLLWYINPESGTTTVYAEGAIRRVPASTWLDGTDVVPGFRVRLQDLLDELAALQRPEGE